MFAYTSCYKINSGNSQISYVLSFTFLLGKTIQWIASTIHRQFIFFYTSIVETRLFRYF